MAIYKWAVKPIRPAMGPLAKMVGAGALAQIAQLQSGGLPLQQVQEVIGEGLRALDDKANAINTLLKLPGSIEVDGSLLPFTPPGGTSGQLQANNGSGGFSAVTTSAGIAASISDETGSGPLVFATSPTIATPAIASFVNATHNHQSAAGGGALDAAAVTTGTFAQEAWTTASLGNSWVDGALSGDQVAGYRKDREGGIWGRGVAKNGTTTDGTTIYTLGAGYRPTSPVRIPVTVFDVTPAFIAAPAILRIGTDGTVQIYSAPAGTVYICLSFSFPNV